MRQKIENTNAQRYCRGGQEAVGNDNNDDGDGDHYDSSDSGEKQKKSEASVGVGPLWR